MRDFSDLPAEIRLELYDIIAATNTYPLSEFKGLYMSCKQIKKEMDAGIVDKLEQLIRKSWTYNHPDYFLTVHSKNFRKVRRVTLFMPSDHYPRGGPLLDSYSAEASLDPVPVHKLLHLPLESLTLRVYRRRTDRVHPLSYLWYFNHNSPGFLSYGHILRMLHPQDADRSTPNVRSIVHEFAHHLYIPDQIVADIHSIDLKKPSLFPGWRADVQLRASGSRVNKIIWAALEDLDRLSNGMANTRARVSVEEVRRIEGISAGARN